MAATAAAVGIALTACSSPMQAGAAAVVGSERISMSQLDEDTQAYVSALRNAKLDQQTQAQLAGNSLEEVVLQGAPASQRVLLRMTEVSAFRQLLARYNVQVSQAEIDGVLRNPGQYPSAELNLLFSGVAPQEAREYGRVVVGVSKLQQQFGGESGQQRLIQEFSAIKPVFSPRYGVLNQQRSQQNPALFVDSGRFGKVTQQSAQPLPQG
ncbi:hypothetical protein ITP53_24540 [Nonomuraea sp. K274]|uniref:Peptidyl-prolyl cis-trans isomerase SurA n=1 Tax=Nonomuraea cypriaca TaxID=1187855 RepID=A0A931A9N8_9ACTN|nr:hypothetical protein [Nonomuraea cypriaca]MBF8188846.1 hypothetical protein [Nonomuraea cypriaca]